MTAASLAHKNAKYITDFT